MAKRDEMVKQAGISAVAGLKVKTGIKGGRLAVNHNFPGLKVKTGLKAGRLSANHNAPSLRVKTASRPVEPR